MEQFKETFKQEAYELLPQIEENLLEIEKDPQDSEAVQKVYRALHTLKGSGSMFGFNNIATFIHEFEDLFDLIRNGKLQPDKQIIDLTLVSCDFIKLLLDNTEGEGWVDEAQKNELTHSIRELMGKPAEDVSSGKKVVPGTQSSKTTYRIRFIPNKEIYLNGTNLMLLFKELQELGEFSITAYLDKVPDLDEINPEHCYTYWDMVLVTPADLNDVRSVFMFVEDNCELNIEEIDSDSQRLRIGEILVERGDISREVLDKVIEKKKMIGEILIDEGLVNRQKINSALQEQQRIDEVKTKKEQKIAQTSVRIPSERLDQLVNLVGELVTTQARLNQLSERIDDSELQSIAEETERMIWELRDSTMNIRMLPMSSAFNRMRRLVRDLSSEMNKEIELTIEGEETELDKSIIEKLNDPLVHLIRNSIDHGLESPAERKRAGKSEKGHIHLSAIHSGASVIISIWDDGKGMNRDAIRERAVEKGLISPDDKLDDQEIFKLVFEAGFSTAKEVTNVSGRGVGMDVVQKNISSLRGSIEIDSVPGEFTKISLKMPLTLAIIDGMMVEIGGHFYVFPLFQIESVVDFSDKELARAEGRDMVRIRGEVVPFINLKELMKIKSTEEDNNNEEDVFEKIVLINTEDKKIGFLVDNIIGKHQTVIKSLGMVYQNVRGVSGATILGTGDIALILDPEQLVRIVKKSEEREVKRK